MELDSFPLPWGARGRLKAGRTGAWPHFAVRDVPQSFLAADPNQLHQGSDGPESPRLTRSPHRCCWVCNSDVKPGGREGRLAGRPPARLWVPLLAHGLPTALVLSGMSMGKHVPAWPETRSTLCISDPNIGPLGVGGGSAQTSGPGGSC